MQIAFLYPGQGSQKLGMGQELYEKYPTYQKTMAQVDPEETYRKLMFGQDLEALSRTENTQPCLVSMGIAVTALLAEKGIRPQFTAGLSLGEYNALCTAGVFSPETAVELVAYRGKVMAEGVKDRDCAMYAVLNLDKEKLQQACDEASALGVVEIANYNCPGQLVMAGDTKAVEKAAELAKELGARRCLPLQVSGPFHTSLMSGAGEALSAKFKAMDFGDLAVPVVFNATAKTLQSEENVADLLVKQVQSSVYFEDSIRFMLAQGIDTFVEVGSGKVLSGFVKKIDPSATICNVEDEASLLATLELLK